MARPRKELDEKLVDIPCKVLPSVDLEIQAIAIKQKWSRSQVARYFVEAALLQFKNSDLCILEWLEGVGQTVHEGSQGVATYCRTSLGDGHTPPHDRTIPNDDEPEIEVDIPLPTLKEIKPEEKKVKKGK